MVPASRSDGTPLPISGRGTHTPPHRSGGGAVFPPQCTSMFIALAGSELPLSTGTTQAPRPPVPSHDLFLPPTFVQTLATELGLDPIFWLILHGADAALGRLVDRHGAPVTDPARIQRGRTFLVLCGLLYRRGPGAADHLCISAGGGLRAQVLLDCHNGPLWARQDVVAGAAPCLLGGPGLPLAEYVRSCQTCQCTKAEHGGPRGLLHPLPLPSQCCGMIGVDWIAGLPPTAAAFDMMQNHVDLLSGKVHAVTSSLVQPTTRTPTPRTSGPTASSATRCSPTPTAAGTTGTVICR